MSRVQKRIAGGFIIIRGEIWHPTTSGEWKGVDPHTFKWNLLQDIILQISTPTNGWISSPRTSFLSTPRTQTPTGRILSSKTCVRILMQMAGSVCSCSAQNCHFYICICIWQMFLKKHFLNWQFLEHIESILVLPGTHKPPSYAPPHCVSPECSVITSHPVASCHIITVQHGTSVGQDQTVTQHLWWVLHLQDWGGPGGGIIGSGCGSLPWIEEALLLCTVLPICSYTYTTTTTVPGH